MAPSSTDGLGERVARAATAAFPGCRVGPLRRLPGGLSSLTFSTTLALDGRDLGIVVKVAPPGLAPRANRDVLRQAQVLDALRGLAGFPVPAVLFRDAGEPPEVPPLFAMELAPGDAYEPLLDVAADPPTPAVAAERMRVATRALAALHAASPTALGLADVDALGLATECERWTRLFATIDDDVCRGRGDLERRLTERFPAPRPARVHHGDYRLANMLFVGAQLSAVVDWEIWSVGDPRFDLGWLVIHTAPRHLFHDRRPDADEAAGSQVPDADAVVAEYLGAAGADEGASTDLDWFVAAGQYKGASTVAALHKRERRRTDPDPLVMAAGSRLDDMIDAGHRALDRWT